MSDDDDDKPTVVLDLNALKKEKLKQEEELANIESELEFNVHPDQAPAPRARAPKPHSGTSSVAVPEIIPLEDDSELFAEKFLDARAKTAEEKSGLTVILFDFQSDFFQKKMNKFPKGHSYHLAKNLPELNKFLTAKTLQIVVFNYDVNPKAVNQLTAQIKQKFPMTKTMIMATAISPQKALLHAKTPSGANGYYQFPLEGGKIETEFQKIRQAAKKVS
ncbi:MAG: hypothetical protein NDI69_02885 [Bacteriovoracaceae bacterium]|nr:hypothetical protein [Bacteriovoracaceae bacterium]